METLQDNKEIETNKVAGDQTMPTNSNKFKSLLKYIFIDGMSGMALGLFATLIAGTIIWQIGYIINGMGSAVNVVGSFLQGLGKLAQIAMGAGIGVGICAKLKQTSPLVIASVAGASFISSYSSALITFATSDSGLISLLSAGDPMGAFVGGMTALSLAKLVSGKTQIDILVTPITALVGGTIVGVAVGYPVSICLIYLGTFISYMASLSTVSASLTGMVVATIMGICLTLPISSAAIGISIGLGGVSAGAAVVGCCCQMIGFAVISFKDNGLKGLLAQGLGTSMLQIPNIFKKPILFLPAILSSMVLGCISPLLPLGNDLVGLTATSVGSGMGSAGLVGPIDLVFNLINSGANGWLIFLWSALMCFILPAVLTYGFYLIFKKFNLISDGDMKLDL